MVHSNIIIQMVKLLSGLYKNDIKVGKWIYNNAEGIIDTTINYNE